MSSVQNATTGEFLRAKCKQLRNDVLDMCVKAGSGHVSSCFSCIEIMVALYYNIMKDDDIFLMSKGQASPLLYAILADKGIIHKSELGKFCQANGKLGVHLDHNIAGVHSTFGSLGYGLGIGAGMAKCKPDKRIFVLLGDAECMEGSIYEAALFAQEHKLSNLTAIVDFNGWGVLKRTTPTLVTEFWRGLQWHILDSYFGNDINEVVTSLGGLLKLDWKPRVMIAHTTKGKGISFMEDNYTWHGVAPQGKEARMAKNEISA